MPQLVSFEFNQLQHIGIPVKNLEASKAFYQLFGFEEVMRKPFGHLEGKGLCIMMKKGNIMLEFYQLLASTVTREIVNRSDGHIDHIAFDVKDIDIAFHAITEAGFNPIQLDPEKLDFWEKGCRFFHILGPDGERLEFNQVI